MIHNLDSAGGGVGINRSASTAGEHMGSGMLNGLPKRADTFGGFDSQQRFMGDNSQVCDNRLLLQVLINMTSHIVWFRFHVLCKNVNVSRAYSI